MYAVILPLREITSLQAKGAQHQPCCTKQIAQYHTEDIFKMIFLFFFLSFLSSVFLFIFTHCF